jgi:cytochrome c oxidase subunit 2
METFVTQILHLPPVVAEHGTALDNLMLYVHLLMFLLLVGWSLFFGYTIYRFRQSKHPKADYHGVRSHASSYLEAAVALVEAVLLIGFAVPLWARGATASNFPAEKDATVVRVIGRQFNWIARYPGPDGVFGKGDPRLVSSENPLGVDPNDPKGKDDVVVQNSEMYVPLGKPVIAYIGSLDVIHCFAVKPMRVTQDAIPGLSIPVWFKPTQTGSYQINCAQLCGNGHSTMRGLLHVVKPEEFDAWIKKQAKSGAGGASYE